MTRPPHLCLQGKRILWQWTRLVAPANDALRCMALATAANDDDWRGRIA
jgi:hypothetical protein